MKVSCVGITMLMLVCAKEVFGSELDIYEVRDVTVQFEGFDASRIGEETILGVKFLKLDNEYRLLRASDQSADVLDAYSTLCEKAGGRLSETAEVILSPGSGANLPCEIVEEYDPAPEGTSYSKSTCGPMQVQAQINTDNGDPVINDFLVLGVEGTFSSPGQVFSAHLQGGAGFIPGCHTSLSTVVFGFGILMNNMICVPQSSGYTTASAEASACGEYSYASIGLNIRDSN